MGAYVDVVEEEKVAMVVREVEAGTWAAPARAWDKWRALLRSTYRSSLVPGAGQVPFGSGRSCRRGSGWEDPLIAEGTARRRPGFRAGTSNYWAWPVERKL